MEGLVEALEREREAVLVEIAVAAFLGRTEAGAWPTDGSEGAGSSRRGEQGCERAAE